MKFLMLLVVLLTACGGSTGDDPAPRPAEDAVRSESIDETLARHTERLMAIEGIQGVGEGRTDDGRPCVLILATVPAEQLAGAVPDTLEGWPVRIDSGDEIRPMH